jgi:hypothetical protein
MRDPHVIKDLMGDACGKNAGVDACVWLDLLDPCTENVGATAEGSMPFRVERDSLI